MDNATIKLRITNTYERGREVITESTITVPSPPPEGWELDYIYPETGTGQTEGDAWYDVTIIESTDPALLGLTFNFGY